MKKIACLLLVTALSGLSAELFANTCAGRLRNLDFYGAFLDKEKNARCLYRYCYYTCIMDSYTEYGYFKPGSGYWKQDENNRFSCSSYNPNNCEFVVDKKFQ